MSTRTLPGLVRTALPWVAGVLGFHALVALVGWTTAWRRNEGDANSLGIRRTLTHAGLELRPTNPHVSRLRVDLAMAGAEIDLTGIPQPPTGIDLTLHVLMAGVAVRVPAGWRVWWEFRGLGGIGSDGTVGRTHDAHAADVRIYATVLLGGVGVEGSAG